MSIQYINLGTAPKGVDGDTQRTANLKMNGNIRYLDGQLTAAKQTADSAQAKAIEAADSAEKAFAKTGGVISGAIAVRYAGSSAGSSITIDNTNGVRGSLDFAVGGIPKGGLSVYKQGSEYIASITGTATDSSHDARAGLVTLSKSSVWTQAYGNLHDYFVRKDTTDAIRTIGEGFKNSRMVESRGFASEIQSRGVQIFIREVFGQYAESVLRTYGNNVTARDFSFRLDGNAYAPGAWLNASDIRLKDDIVPLAGMRATLDAIQPIHYRMNGQDSIGYSAQEVQASLPCCVRVSGQAVDKNGRPVPDALAMDYSAMTAFNTQVLKEQEAIIRKLLDRVLQLEKVLGVKELA